MGAQEFPPGDDPHGKLPQVSAGVAADDAGAAELLPP